MIRARGIDDIIERNRREADAGGERFVDLRLDFVDELTGELWLTVGGRWDRRLRAFDGEPEQRVVVRCHAGQREAVFWFRGWLDAHLEKRANPAAPPTPEEQAAFMAELAAVLAGEVEIDCDPSRVYTAMCGGGRRGGKSWIGVRLGVAYAIAIPGSIVWLAAPEEDGWEELRVYTTGCVAEEWLQHKTALEWTLCNGSTLALKSAYDPDALKEGRVDFALLNEAQRIKERAFTVLQLSVADVGGLVLMCANPPREAGDQEWVDDFAVAAQQGKRAAVFLQFNPLLNPHTDKRAYLAFAANRDQRAVDEEIFGIFGGAKKDRVAFNWQRVSHEKPMPADGECTAELLELLENVRGCARATGSDFQIHPYIAAAELRFFGRPTRDEVLVWIAGEVVVEGDEVALSDGMYDAGWQPEETLIVGDGTGQYQHTRRRKADSPPPEWRGRGSFDILRGEGWRYVVQPDPRIRNNNPKIVDRVRALVSLIRANRLYCDPDRAPVCARTLREWKNVNGKPSRVAKVAHMGDAITYPLIRLFPRRAVSGTPSRAVKSELAAKIEKHLAARPYVDPRDLPPALREEPRRLDRFGPTSRDRRRGL